MNLTSKRMLQFMTVCAGVCALSASAAYVQDSFEMPAGTNGNLVTSYKRIISGDGGTITNAPWEASADGDVSSITNGIGAAYAGDKRPAVGASTFDQALNLSTEGTTLSRKLDAQLSFTSQDRYVDTLIKFTPSEDAPTIDPTAKIAVYVDVNSNLVVHHRCPSGLVLTNSVFADRGPIDPSKWYRLTIQLGYREGNSIETSKIYLDGIALTNEFTVDDSYVAGVGGEWFINAADGSYLNAVAFQGTGMVDDLVVADEADLGVPTTIMLTLAFDSTKAAVSILGGASVTNHGQVATDAQIVIDANDWYAVTNVAFSGSDTYSGTVGSTVNVSTGTVSGANNDVITFQVGQYSGGTFSTGEGAVDTSKLTAWALGHGVSPSVVAGTGWLDEYLLGVTPNTGVAQQLQITKIEMITGYARITIGATVAVNFQALNGVLKVVTMNTLGGTTTERTYNVTGTAAAVIDVPLADGKFMKATVK